MGSCFGATVVRGVSISRGCIRVEPARRLGLATTITTVAAAQAGDGDLPDDRDSSTTLVQLVEADGDRGADGDRDSEIRCKVKPGVSAITVARS